MSERRRHAIYFAPEPGALARFGAGWLGWDAEAGVEAERPAMLPAGLAARRAEITAEPRRYGFHGTLKAPFALAGEATVAALDEALAALAAGRAGFGLAMRVATIGRFVALVPAGGEEAIAALAAACVTGLDGFRAPPSDAEMARRRAAGLDAAAEALLVRWGYPYVLERFRFHMTLTGPLEAGEREGVRGALAATMAPLLGEPMAVGSVCRFSEGADGRFRLVRRFRLGCR